MKRLLPLVSFIIIIALLSSCKRSCPEFNTSVLEWMPYENNDTIKFINTNRDSTKTLSINNVYINHTTTFPSFGTKCSACFDDVSIAGKIDNHSFIFSLYLSEGKEDFSEIEINNDRFTKNSEAENYLFDNTKYDFARIYEYSSSNIKTLIIAKGFGIIGFIDSTNNTWSINQGASILKGKPRNVKVNNSPGC